MLLEFTCSNYKSIHKRVKLSMIAGSDDTREEELIQYDKYRINRMSVIYGPNGSGKTTLLDAILCAGKLIRNSMKQEPGDILKVPPHKLSKPDEPTEFVFQYVTRGSRFAYGFSVLSGKVDEEFLYYFPNKRQAKIFSRKGLKIDAGDSFRKFSDTSLEALKDNRLFLACAANYTSIPDIENAFLFFKTELQGFSNAGNGSVIPAIRFMTKHPELKDMYLKIADYLNTGIRNITARYEQITYTADELPDDMPESIKSFLMKKGSTAAEATVVYDQFSTDLESEESTGIKKLFSFLYPYLDTLRKGNVLICDEIESGLHEAIVMGILQLFSQLYPEKNAQIIFTTHDTSLLDGELFRRDQIWFTELDSERSTDLYSLAEIRNVRKSENLKRGYVSGKYGAFPMMNCSLYQEMLDEYNSFGAVSETLDLESEEE